MTRERTFEPRDPVSLVHRDLPAIRDKASEYVDVWAGEQFGFAATGKAFPMLMDDCGLVHWRWRVQVYPVFPISADDFYHTGTGNSLREALESVLASAALQVFADRDPDDR